MCAWSCNVSSLKAPATALTLMALYTRARCRDSATGNRYGFSVDTIYQSTARRRCHMLFALCFPAIDAFLRKPKERTREIFVSFPQHNPPRNFLVPTVNFIEGITYSIGIGSLACKMNDVRLYVRCGLLSCSRQPSPMAKAFVIILFKEPHMLQRYTVPHQFKQAWIRPVPKVTVPTQHSDFRPISVTPVLTRVYVKKLTSLKLIVRTI